MNTNCFCQIEDNYFSNDKLFFCNDCPLLNTHKDYINESFDFINSSNNDLENNNHNMDIQNFLPDFKIKIEIPEKTNQIEKKSTAIFTNTNTSQLFVSFEKIESILKEFKDPDFNIYIRKIKEFKNNQEIKEIEYEMNLLKKKEKIME